MELKEIRGSHPPLQTSSKVLHYKINIKCMKKGHLMFDFSEMDKQICMIKQAMRYF
jgi:hypothetical protein